MFETLGQYKILDRIGAGGMGELFRARDTRLGRTVAVKVIAAEVVNDTARRERLLEDARATMALSHPAIATLYEVGEDQGQLFLAFRSEEHTSELQSRFDLVCRLLLEKKKIYYSKFKDSM